VKRLVIAVIVALAALGSAGSALADGDPGSDVLVYQNLFAGADSGLSVAQQLKIGRRLDAAARSGRPLRVAIIARRDDLGAVTGLWGKPRAYARFLGLELSIAYRGRLLVVMPGGLGVSRGGGHPDAAGTRAVSGIAGGASAGGLTSAALAAIARLSTLPAAGPGRRVEKPSTVGRNSTRLVPAAPAEPAEPAEPAVPTRPWRSSCSAWPRRRLRSPPCAAAALTRRA
jgi:hypothetical protein